MLRLVPWDGIRAVAVTFWPTRTRVSASAPAARSLPSAEDQPLAASGELLRKQLVNRAQAFKRAVQ